MNILYSEQFIFKKPPVNFFTGGDQRFHSLKAGQLNERITMRIYGAEK